MTGRRRAHALGAAVAVLAALVVPRGLGPVAGVEPDRPNVVVIMTDDQTLKSLQVMPNVQALIGDAGVTFDDFMVSYALCCPSRATFLSGQYAFHHQVLNNDPPYGGYEAFDHTNSLPVWLQTAGYRTIQLGKYLNHYDDQSADTIPPGWDDWQAFYPGGYFDYSINDNGVPVHYGRAPEDYSTDVLSSRAVNAIAESAPGGPFFLNITPLAPHNTPSGPAEPAPRHAGMFATEPLPNPPSFNERDVTDKPLHIQALPQLKQTDVSVMTTRYRGQLESLQAVDEMVADVIAALDASGELDNTVVMFTSDNGYSFGEHRIAKGKGHPYDESIRVPLMVRGPGFPAGTTSNVLTANIDLAPTISAIAGAVPQRVVDGIDLRATIQDPSGFADRNVLIEGYNESLFPCFNGVRTTTAAFWQYDTGEEELYDLTTDPYQLTSLHADPTKADLRSDMLARLATFGLGAIPCATAAAEITVGDAAVVEPTGPGKTILVSVPVRMSRSLGRTTRVDYTVGFGTASSADATVGSGTLSFGSTRTTNNVQVEIKGDILTESPETLTVTISTVPSDQAVVARPVGTITILDGAPLGSPVLGIGDLVLTEGDWAGEGSVYVIVTLSRPVSVPTSVSFVAYDGEAVLGSDYGTSSGVVTIRANQRSAKLALRISSDEIWELPESFAVMLTPPAGISVGRGTGTITILDDDAEA